MAKTNCRSVDEYIALQPDGVQRILGRVRSAICKAVASAVEVISYTIPAYQLRGTTILYFAGWKQHFSLYPASERVFEAFSDELAPYRIGKGTIRFPLSEPVPEKLIGRIAKLRAMEIFERKMATPIAIAATVAARIERRMHALKKGCRTIMDSALPKVPDF